MEAITKEDAKKKLCWRDANNYCMPDFCIAWEEWNVAACSKHKKPFSTVQVRTKCRESECSRSLELVTIGVCGALPTPPE